jgi:hypothetical protein
VAVSETSHKQGYLWPIQKYQTELVGYCCEGPKLWLVVSKYLDIAVDPTGWQSGLKTENMR